MAWSSTGFAGQVFRALISDYPQDKGGLPYTGEAVHRWSSVHSMIYIPGASLPTRVWNSMLLPDPERMDKREQGKTKGQVCHVSCNVGHCPFSRLFCQIGYSSQLANIQWTPSEG